MTRALNFPLSLPRERIDDFCRRWKISTMAMSRSRSESDPGVIVRFEPEAEWNLSDRLRMQRELQQLSGHGVQVRSRLATRRNGGYTLNVIYNA